MDSFLIALVVMAIAALSNWLQRRAQANEDQVPPSPPSRPGSHPRPGGSTVPTGPPQRPNIDTSLERELRRLLGQEPKPPPPARPIVTSAPAPPPMRQPAPAPPVLSPEPGKPPLVASAKQAKPAAAQTRPAIVVAEA